MDDRANGAELARLAGVLADTSRATMLLGLLDGRAWTAAELASHAGIARSTATEHLHVLQSAGLIQETRQGRHRYLRIADGRTARMIELLSSRLEPTPPPPSLRGVNAHSSLLRGRTCYDHLAGRLGVGVCEAFATQGFLDERMPPRLSRAGERWCHETGIDIDALRRARRPEVLLCLDWTERREHLGGGLGKALKVRFEALGWIRVAEGSRAVRVTDVGRESLETELGLVDL